MENVKKIVPSFEDNRGTISDILDGEIRHIGIITSKSGAVRGKHYHKKATQYIYVLSGKLKSFTKDLRKENPRVESKILVPRDLEITPPMVVHSHKALEETVFLVLTTEPRIDGGYEGDTFRVDLDIE